MSNENQTIATPAHNPADIQNMGGTTEFIVQKALQKLEKIAPAQIMSYDRNKNRATVQVLNQAITSTGEKITRKPLVDIPVVMLSGGGFTLSFPIKQGDKGWILAADRDISVFKSLLKVFAPATYQKHRYKDGFFLPDKVNGFTVLADEENALILTSDDGLTKITIDNGLIKIQSAAIEITGNIALNGNLMATGEVTAKNIALSTHVHSGVESGTDTTGAPQ